MISVQMFVAVTQLPSFAWCLQSQKTKYVFIATVWGIGCIVSVPHAVIADYRSETQTCSIKTSKYHDPMDSVDLITFCAVPLIITAVFSGLTAYRIRRSIQEILGEATGQQQLQHKRMVSSTVLFALTVVLVFSYTPHFLFRFLIFEMCISVPFWEYFLVRTITYHLRFVNCCLNSIVLFVIKKNDLELTSRDTVGRERFSRQLTVEAAQKHHCKPESP